MNNNRARKALLAIVLVFVNAICYAQSAANSLCTPAGYTLGFFNGVWNTYQDAVDGLAALTVLEPSTYNGKAVKAELFYNHTGCGTVGATCLQDIAEVFIQRASELDSSGTLNTRLEYFWESIGSGNTALTQKIKTLFSGASAIFSPIYTSLISQSVAGWSYLSSHPPTASDYAVHNARLDALATEGQMLALVAHSQGNLFMNQAYDHIVPKLGAGSVKAVHIAPASVTLRGPWELADIDLVINALRVQGLFTVPAIDLYLPVSIKDVTGHTLVGTYLDSARPGRAAIKDQLTTALSQLSAPQVDGVHIGSFTVTLTWSGAGDEDLHVFEPGGSHVYYGARAGAVGFLDTDNTQGLGPEHYYASCDPAVLQTGSYRVGINDYSHADGEIATVQVATASDGVILTKQAATGPTLGSAGDNSPQPVLTVTVTKNARTGAFSFSAQ